MASSSPSSSIGSGRTLWDPFQVLDVYPNVKDRTCAGRNATGERRRCGWRFGSYQFDPSRTNAAVRRLEIMSEVHPAEVTSAELIELARNTLCRDHHQGQAYEVEAKWRARIQDYLRTDGGRLAAMVAPRQPQRGISEDRDVYEREMSETRQALGSLTEKHDKLEAERAATSRDLARLSQQLMELQTSVTALNGRNAAVERLKGEMDERNANFKKGIAASAKEIKGLEDGKARLDKTVMANANNIVNLNDKVRDMADDFDERIKRSDEYAERLRQGIQASNDRFEKWRKTEVEDLHRGLRESNARYEALEAKSAADAKRLTERLDALERKYTTSQDENEQLLSRSVEQGGQLEQLGQQMDEFKQELAKRDQRVGQLEEQTEEQTEELKRELMEREEQSSVLQGPRGKRRFFAAISKQPPRELVRKVSRIMTTQSGPYVQSVA